MHKNTKKLYTEKLAPTFSISSSHAPARIAPQTTDFIFKVVKLNNIRGDLPDIPAKIDALVEI